MSSTCFLQTKRLSIHWINSVQALNRQAETLKDCQALHLILSTAINWLPRKDTVLITYCLTAKTVKMLQKFCSSCFSLIQAVLNVLNCDYWTDKVMYRSCGRRLGRRRRTCPPRCGSDTGTPRRCGSPVERESTVAAAASARLAMAQVTVTGSRRGRHRQCRHATSDATRNVTSVARHCWQRRHHRHGTCALTALL